MTEGKNGFDESTENTMHVIASFLSIAHSIYELIPAYEHSAEVTKEHHAPDALKILSFLRENSSKLMSTLFHKEQKRKEKSAILFVRIRSELPKILKAAKRLKNAEEKATAGVGNITAAKVIKPLELILSAIDESIVDQK